MLPEIKIVIENFNKLNLTKLNILSNKICSACFEKIPVTLLTSGGKFIKTLKKL